LVKKLGLFALNIMKSKSVCQSYNKGGKLSIYISVGEAHSEVHEAVMRIGDDEEREDILLQIDQR